MNLKKIAIFILVIIFTFIFSVSIFAFEEDNELNITLIEMDESDKNYYLHKLSLTVVDEESDIIKDAFNSYSDVSDIYKRNFIYCFDVSDDGKCAVFFDNNTVVIFENDGSVSKVLKFDSTLSSTSNAKSNVQILWNESNLWLLDGENHICVFATDGEIIDVYNYETPERVALPLHKEITVGNNTYKMEYSNFLVHFLGGNRYDLLIRTNAVGEKEVLFDCEKALPNITVTVLLFLIVFNVLALFIIIKIFKRKAGKKDRGRFSVLTRSFR